MSEVITRRSIGSYARCIPDKVSGGSKAQMDHFVADAKADIALLYSTLTSAQAEIERLTKELGRLELSRGAASKVALDNIARAEAAEKERDALREALKPSGNTKAAYISEFQFPFTYYAPDEDGETVEVNVEVTIPWTSIKEVMAAIRARALQPQEPHDAT